MQRSPLGMLTMSGHSVLDEKPAFVSPAFAELDATIAARVAARKAERAATYERWIKRASEEFAADARRLPVLVAAADRVARNESEAAA
jgi:hypothetical protein